MSDLNIKLIFYKVNMNWLSNWQTKDTLLFYNLYWNNNRQISAIIINVPIYTIIVIKDVFLIKI